MEPPSRHHIQDRVVLPPLSIAVDNGLTPSRRASLVQSPSSYRSQGYAYANTFESERTSFSSLKQDDQVRPFNSLTTQRHQQLLYSLVLLLLPLSIHPSRSVIEIRPANVQVLSFQLSSSAIHCHLDPPAILHVRLEAQGRSAIEIRPPNLGPRNTCLEVLPCRELAIHVVSLPMVLTLISC